MNWGQIRSLARTKLTDTIVPYRWSDAELLTYATEIQDYLVTDAEANVKSFAFALTNGTRTYAVPSDLYEIRSIRINGRKTYGAVAMDMEDLDTAYMTTLGDPQWYYLEGNSTIAFYPIPNHTASPTTFTQDRGEVDQWNDGSVNFTFSQETGCLSGIIDDSMAQKYFFTSLLGIVTEVLTQDVCEIEYVYRPPNVVYDSDLFDVPRYLDYAICYGVVARAAAKDGKAQNLMIAKRYKGRFDELTKEWFARNKEYARGQNQMFSQQPVDWGSDLVWRQRVFP